MAKWTVCLATLLCLEVAVCLTWSNEPLPANGTTRELTLDDIFPTDRVVDVQITVAQQDWDTLRYQSRSFFTALSAERQFKPPARPYTYVEASVSINGVMFPKVGLRKKGFIGSLSETRPSLKIKLNHIDKKGEIDGLTLLTLNNNKQDLSQTCQFMGYALFNATGSAAPRCAYAKVTVNGKNLGIYSHVESIREPLLKRAFGNADGTLYEGTVVDFYEEWDQSFEHKRGDDKRGRARINQLIDVLAVPQTTEQDIGELVELDAFYRFWAVESLIGFWDGYSGNNNNFFIYLNPDTDKFHFLPWGADSLFVKMSKLDFQKNPRAPISVKTQGLIAYKLYQLESGRDRYRKAMLELLENHWDEGELLAEVDRISALIAPHLMPQQRVIEDEEWWEKDKNQTFVSELEATRDFIRTRKSEILLEIIDGMPVWQQRPHPPFIVGPDGDFMKGFLKFTENTLVGAARTGDIEAIKQHLAEGADVNETRFEMPPVAWAAIMGQTQAAELLIQHGADVNGRNRDGNTALHLAAFLGHAETAELLIKNGANVTAKNQENATPADTLGTPWEMTVFLTKPLGIKVEQKQVEAGRVKIAKMLGTSPPVLSKGKSTAKDIFEAAYTGDLNAMEKRFAAGVDVDARHPLFGSTLLSTAALMGHPKIVVLLLEKGADVNARDRDGGTPLHAAAFLGRADTVKILLKHGADTTTRNKDGTTPMEAAKLDWGLTQLLVGMLQIEVDEAEVKAGRVKVVALLSEHNR